MDTVVQCVGIVVLLLGIVYLLKPDVVKWLMRFFRQGRRIYFAAVIRLALAVVFLLAASECDIRWVIVTFGIIFLISGVLIFVMGTERIRLLLDWYLKQSAFIFRIIALLVMAVGAIIIYSA